MLLPESANPLTSAQQPIAVNKVAPENATVGQIIDYTISLEYTGELTGLSPPITVTDALPPQVVFRGFAISDGVCPTMPAPGQGGTVECTVQFAPGTRTITITIRAEPVATGTVTNLVQLSTGETDGATTTVGPAPSPPPGGPPTARPAPAGSVAMTVDGPASLALPASLTTRAAPFRYTIAVTYNGTFAGLSDQVYVEVTSELPEQVLPRGWGLSTESSGTCPTVAAMGPGLSGGTYVCRLNYHSTRPRTNTLFFEVRPFATGVATNTVRLSTGETVVTTTEITRPSPPPAPPAPEPVAGPPAAPTKAVVETFTRAGETEAQSATIAPSAKTTQVALTWPDADSSFDATGFRIVRNGQVVARAPSSVTAKVRPGKLRVTKRRTARSLDVRIKGLRPGRLIYRIVARRLDGRTRVVARVRQSRRG